MKGWFSSFRPLCSVFTHVARNYANLLEKRKRLRKKYSSPPTGSLTGLVCETNTTTVSLFSNTDVCCVWPPRRHQKTLHTLSTQLMKPFQCQWHVLDLFSACNHWCCPIVHQALRLSKSHETGFFSSPVCLYYHRWMHGKFNRYFHCCFWPKTTRVTILRTCWPRCIVVWLSDRVCSLIWQYAW